MKKIYWNKLPGFGKFIFVLGWLSVLSILFWIVMLIYYFAAKERKFFSPGSFRIVYVFGWLNFIGIIVMLVFMFTGMFWLFGRLI